MKTEQPLWGGGSMISPQHFQQQAVYAAWPAECIAQMGLNHLSVRSPMPVAQLQEQFPRQCKVGSLDHVQGIVNSSRMGGSLTPLRHVPAAIPLRLENQYFSLDLSHPLAPTDTSCTGGKPYRVGDRQRAILIAGSLCGGCGCDCCTVVEPEPLAGSESNTMAIPVYLIHSDSWNACATA